MGTHYTQLSLDERMEIFHLLKNGHSYRAIAGVIGRSVSTISREVARNARPTKRFAGGYLATRAHELALRRRRWDARFKMQRQPALRNYVRDRLAMGWSPEQIAGRLALDDAPMRISHESIYRYVYHRSAQKDWWHKLLPQAKSHRGRMKRGGLGSVEYIKHRRTLDERPWQADGRKQPGHWEADLMSFAKYGQYVLVLHERVSRIIRIVRLANKTAAHVAAKIARTLKILPECLRRTITFDNGTEFSHHYKLHRQLGVETFFCDTRAPWQKGGVENAIGRMRRPLPRKAGLATLADRKITQLAEAYNNTPRKCLNYQTPNEIFNRVALQT
ncbi:integrase core domain protein [bacterium BMS3Bbin10]|nr:integrase core domain protein [bacterium BMS3Bbin10]